MMDPLSEQPESDQRAAAIHPAVALHERAQRGGQLAALFERQAQLLGQRVRHSPDDGRVASRDSDRRASASLRGTASPSDASVGGGSVTWRARTSVALLPSNGRRPEKA